MIFAYTYTVVLWHIISACLKNMLYRSENHIHATKRPVDCATYNAHWRWLNVEKLFIIYTVELERANVLMAVLIRSTTALLMESRCWATHIRPDVMFDDPDTCFTAWITGLKFNFAQKASTVVALQLADAFVACTIYRRRIGGKSNAQTRCMTECMREYAVNHSTNVHGTTHMRAMCGRDAVHTYPFASVRFDAICYCSVRQKGGLIQSRLQYFT